VSERTLRIVAGVWKNRRLVVAPGSRPTAERAREAFFDILGDWVPGKRFLELYAGSGAIAFEALSRGASGAVAVDRDTRALERNRDTLSAGVEILRVPARDAVRDLARRGERFDLVFLDPPYDAEDTITVAALAPLLAVGGRVVWQGDSAADIDAAPLRAVRRAAYGRNVFTFLEAR
jgi:16S rRNA (guanine(966)-N(2))-methyltransferase RsmD